ncbi:hypothetical protein J6590_024406 [Homalodisca vitripennis]|nr:hypothetical protein J6590_024406 [Homalodisca vitripennis]
MPDISLVDWGGEYKFIRDNAKELLTTARRDTHPAGWTPPPPLSSRPWLPRAPHLDDDPTALNDPEVTLTDPSPLFQTAVNGPRHHNIMKKLQ